MKKSKKKLPLVIEFTGVPGSGKSTIAHLIGEKIEKNNLRVFYYDQYFSRTSHKRFLQLKNILFNIVPFTKYFFLLLKLTKKCKKDYLSIKYILASLLNYGGKYILYRSRKYDYVIVDQGIIQEIESITCYIKGEKNYNLLYQFIHDNFNMLIIDVNVELNEALSRINKRKAGASRIDFIKDSKEQLNNLNIENDTFISMRKSNKCVEHISITSSNINENVSEIYNFIIGGKND